LKPQSGTNGAKPVAVDFVSETDVRSAVEKGEKIYVTAKTIITPAARDLGDEKEIFAAIK
jgi:ethanolamine utilization cobalamin adenosyltransferase